MWGPELITQAEALSHLAVSEPLGVMRPRVTLFERLIPALMLMAGALTLAAGLTKPSFDTAWPRYLATVIFYTIGLLSALTLKRAKQPESWFMAVSGSKLLLNTQDYLLSPARAEGTTVLSLPLQNITALEPHCGVVLVASLIDLRKGITRTTQPFSQLVVRLSEPLPASVRARLDDELVRCIKHRPRGMKDGIAFLQRHALWMTDDQRTLVVHLRPAITPNLPTFLEALGPSVPVAPLQTAPFGDAPFAVLGYRGEVKTLGTLQGLS